MRKIDRETVQRILDTARIEEVVADYVTLRRRGSGYVGLCPFHNERTPSFSVSPSRGVCKCFSCGKGGSPVNFIMEIEQMTYREALLHLAKKYHIEVADREMTPEETEAESERASMYAVNEFAAQHASRLLAEDPEGRAVGLSYLRGRGLNEATIKRFRLGYALERHDDLLTTATRKGYAEKYLLSTGLCIRTETGRVYDRFRGRVIYPVATVSGKIVAFGGRTLSTDKKTAKYINSPESEIYHKQQHLYGLYQAKQAISRQKKALLVEGYMDVLQMHQSGVENVVASSGTSLTKAQVALLHRFAEKVTVVYDADPAGIKASLRGIDMLLAEGLDVKALLLPEGEDPDSYARTHTATEVEEYIAHNEVDFITFKTRLMLESAADDPMARAKVINEVLRSIAVIPDQVARSTYIEQCARLFGADEKMLDRQLTKFIADKIEEETKERLRETYRREAVPAAGSPAPTPATEGAEQSVTPEIQEIARRTLAAGSGATSRYRQRLRPLECRLLRYLVKYGAMPFCEAEDDDGKPVEINVVEAVAQEIDADGMTFCADDLNALYAAILDRARRTREADFAAARSRIAAAGAEEERAGLATLREHTEGCDLGALQANEMALHERVERSMEGAMRDFRLGYIERYLCSCPDDGVRRLATELSAEKYVLSRVHTKYTHVETDDERLHEIVPRAMAEWRDALLACELEHLRGELAAIDHGAAGAQERLAEIMQRMADVMERRKVFAKYMGERVIAP